ncbi:MAG TPA: hypothetical protein VM536_17335 [Chloroflexia bacterium]|nr:hypothetical protein [Chloroflexia bacterium]
MSNNEVASAPTDWQIEQAKELVAQRLGLISMVIWVVGVLLFMTLIYPNRPFRPTAGMFAGVVLVIPAALPWLSYGRLVNRIARQQSRQ